MSLNPGEVRSGGDVFDADGRRVVVGVPAVLPLVGDRDADGRRVVVLRAA